jgi:hypothetical protein
MDKADQIAKRIAEAEERLRQQLELVAELDRAGRSDEARRARELLATISERLSALRRRLREARTLPRPIPPRQP